MTVSYDPGATLDDATWVAVLLSERDVAGQIPINFVTNPAVSLSSACFGNGLYAQEEAAQCISNLLAVGFRRLVLDLYWSVERRTWSFCPVVIPARADVFVSEATSTTEGPSATSTYTTGEVTSTTADADSATITAYSDSNGETVYELGPYRCTDDVDLETISQILVGYFQDTKRDLLVYTTYLVLNLHVAASDSNPTKPPATLKGKDLPKSASERVGALLDVNLRDYLYSPAQLEEDRKNLNESWYEVEESYMPITEYFTIHEDESGQLSTPDGWPSAKYIQLAKSDRVLIEYGSVDPQLAGYNITKDEDAIFPPGYMTSGVKVSATTNGTLKSGCLYKPKATDVSQVNASWATSSKLALPDAEGLSEETTLGSLTNLISDITACGMSPMLNSTLFGKTANEEVSHYRNVSLSTGWAWAIGEPEGAETGGGVNGQAAFDRCAIADLSLGGRWRATNCSEERRAACRVGNSPFSWALSNRAAEYRDVGDGCPSGSSFAVPRTGLENHYLYEFLLSQDKSIIDPSSTNLSRREIYINFNSIDVTSCWVSGGPEASCPYSANPQQLERKTVLVAVVAAIVILIITALTVFIKCNANRRNSRRRKRVIEGWEYEGVPS